MCYSTLYTIIKVLKYFRFNFHSYSPTPVLTLLDNSSPALYDTDY